MYAATRSPGSTPSPRSADAAARDLIAQLAPAERVELAQLGGVLDRQPLGGLAGEQVLGVVEPGAGEPIGARHLVAREHRPVRRRGANREEVPDRGPELLEVADRPAPERVVVAAESQSALGLEPAHVAGHVRALDRLGRGLPEQLPSRRLAHPKTSITAGAAARPPLPPRRRPARGGRGRGPAPGAARV